MSGSGRAGERGGDRAALPAFATAGPGGAEMPPQKSRIPPAPGAVLPVGAPRGHLLAPGTALWVGGRARSGRQTSRIYRLLATADFCICQGANYCL